MIKCLIPILFLLICGCSGFSGFVAEGESGDELSGANVPGAGPKAATSYTALLNQQVAHDLPIDQKRDIDDASRNLIAQLPTTRIYREDGGLAVDIAEYDFMDGERAASVHPSLWSHGHLNRKAGLFGVTQGVYQFRGYDASVMTYVRGKRGWIVIDASMSPAPARASLELVDRYLEKLPITAIIFTHSHRDHFGGVAGILPRAIKNVPIIAPEAFARETAAEHSLAGPHMNERSAYQGGIFIKPGGRGRMGAGLTQSFAIGPMSYAAPTYELREHSETLRLDGVEIVFVDASGTEATSEFVMYLPKYKALHMAEVLTGTQHNVLTPRGAIVRDTLLWSKVIDEMLVRFGDDAEIIMASHHWPSWGNGNVIRKLKNHRNVYRYLHDQVLRRANKGMTMHEIANHVPEPDVMKTDITTRGHYGDYKHNLRAVYQRYFGWWDGVPANLDPYGAEQESARYVEAIGGVGRTLKQARKRAGRNRNARLACGVLPLCILLAPAL